MSGNVQIGVDKMATNTWFVVLGRAAAASTLPILLLLGYLINLILTDMRSDIKATRELISLQQITIATLSARLDAESAARTVSIDLVEKYHRWEVDEAARVNTRLDRIEEKLLNWAPLLSTSPVRRQ